MSASTPTCRLSACPVQFLTVLRSDLSSVRIMVLIASEPIPSSIEPAPDLRDEPEVDSGVFRAAVRNLEAVGLGDVLYTPARQPRSYGDRLNSYWSLTPRARPWAIVQPRNTVEVSKALVALVETDGCKFAIRRYDHINSCM